MESRPSRALIVTLGRARGALAAVRALHDAGWVVGVGTPAGDDMVTASRWCTRRHVVPRPRGDAEAFIDGVRRAVHEGGYDVVFGGADDWMAALATYRESIPARVAHPPAHVVTAALDKVGLAARAAAVGINAPRTELATREVMDGWDGPVVVKCRAHWRPGHQHAYRVEARRYPDMPSATDQIELLRGAGLEPVLQTPLDGQLCALIGLVHAGRLVGRVQQDTSRLWPTPSGVSSRAVTVPLDETLAARASALLAGLGWEGLVELQFLRDQAGVPHLIDLNGRFYGSMALALAAGPNLPHAWGRQTLGHALPPLPDGRPGVRFSWAAGDLRRALVERRGGLVRDLASTVQWVLRAQESVWSVQDPGPTWSLVQARTRSRPGPPSHDPSPRVNTAAG